MTHVTVLLASAAIAGGLLTAAPAAAGPPADPVPGQADGGPRERERRDLGGTSARDGVLRMGCHDYPYRYRLEIRTDDWTLETFLVDRRGETIASGAYLAGPDRKRQRADFRFCRYNTVPGRFTIRAKLMWYTDSGEHQAWLKPSHFRLRRP
ncbi:hypothetical protein GCM10027062_07390 [Nocardioides hungaricus]